MGESDNDSVSLNGLIHKHVEHGTLIPSENFSAAECTTTNTGQDKMSDGTTSCTSENYAFGSETVQVKNEYTNTSCNDISSNQGSLKEDRRSTELLQEVKPEQYVNCRDDCDDENIEHGGFFNRFYFESDHLALKNNSDYQLLLQTLAVLEAQRHQAVKDLEELQKSKATALEDPIGFVESLQSKNPPKLPERQFIAKVPQIDWLKYLTSSSLLKLPSGAQVSTRRSLKSGEEIKYEEITSKDDLSLNKDQLDIFERSQEQALNEPEGLSGVRYVRGRAWNENKSATFNQLWTIEEQEKLEKLLQIYPPEEVESRRYEKIARALGNRTSKQVASRVQKYFIKLARAGLPVPGRVPHFYQKKAKMNPLSYRNSTFFPSWRPSVFMPDDDDDQSSVTSGTAHSEDMVYVSDDETIPTELRDTEEYRELMELKKLKRQKEQCDGCGMDPIVGTRWHCLDCPKDTTTDFCNNCVGSVPQTLVHKSPHEMIAINEDSSFVDDDYLGFEPERGKYNYLDPNFLPTGK